MCLLQYLLKFGYYTDRKSGEDLGHHLIYMIDGRNDLVLPVTKKKARGEETVLSII